METMNAVRIYAYGGREVLTYEKAPRPEVKKDEVLVKVAATTVNPFDWAVRNGYVVDYYQYSFPHILGLDVSGVIEGLGEEVEGFSIGDAVYGRAHPSRNGAYAEYISLPASMVAPRPQSLDAVQAAAVPHAATTAWRGLFDVGELSAGQTVLIHGAAGGVGSFAVQLAKLRGAQVIGTASANNLDFLRELGADQVIDYNLTPFEEVVQDVELVLDLVGDMGNNTQTRSWQVLKPGGLLASPVQFPSPPPSADHGVRGSFVMAEVVDTQILNEIGTLIDGGKLRPIVTTRFPLSEIARAHELSESRHGRGKIVLQVNHS